MRAAIVLAVALAACQPSPAPDAVPDDTPGGRLEAVAVARGLVVDAAKVGLVGSWASETDRLCVVPAAGAMRLGARVDYGQDQTCAASGTVTRDGERLDVRFGRCRFTADFDGERIVFPVELPSACERFCTGRASLAALTVERLSGSVAEATTLRSPGGQPLCPSS